MRKGGGKQKGAQFERQVCWDLSRYVDPDGDDTLFWRSAMSGGRATVQRRKGVKNTTQAGDITPIHSKGSWLTDLFVIECKFYKDLDLGPSILFKKGKLSQFWKEVRKKAKEQGKHPMLIAKQNRADTLVVLTTKGRHELVSLGKDVFLLCHAYKPDMLIAKYDKVFK